MTKEKRAKFKARIMAAHAAKLTQTVKFDIKTEISQQLNMHKIVSRPQKLWKTWLKN